jgi:predicted RNA-binding Zn-ribbon protein involved in translation (DUF1610 family)
LARFEETKHVIEWMELACPHCRWRSQCGVPQMLEHLRRADMVRRDAAPDVELLPELVRGAAPRMSCPKCQQVGLTATPVDDCEDDDEAWGQARSCAGCGQPIPPERLEIFPNTDLCVSCQGKSDQGESFDKVEYCPRCGSVMTLRQQRRGVTRYVMTCSQCRS